MTNSTEAIRVSDERLSEMQRDCGIPNPPTQETYWFRKALAGEGPHAYDWSDKPHRLVFDLCRLIEADAALRSKPVAGVEVKPLEWVKHPNVEAWRAETMLGSYKVFAVALPATWTFYGHAGELIESKSPDVAEAKAAAEADYRQRILSTLSLPAQDPVAMIVRIDGEEEITWLEGGPTLGPGDYLYASPQPETVITEEMVKRVKKLPRSVMETANNNGDVFVSLKSVIAALKEA